MGEMEDDLREIASSMEEMAAQRGHEPWNLRALASRLRKVANADVALPNNYHAGLQKTMDDLEKIDGNLYRAERYCWELRRDADFLRGVAETIDKLIGVD